ncbi:MAG: hypothetical protein NW216_07595 [Hyphomicrobium sp.]|nr:hypothetical protein [Hyphomicrobium sp.]
MRGEKIVEFEKPFLYSFNGQFEEATSITVRAPGLPHLAVHAKVQAALARAILAFPRPDRKPDAADEGVDHGEDESDGASGAAPEIDALQVLAAGYDENGYADFLKWLKRTLTNQPKLAFVTGTDCPVTDEVWDSISEEGGLDAVFKVLSAFVGFFLAALGADSKKTNGPPAVAGSASRTKAA